MPVSQRKPPGSNQPGTPSDWDEFHGSTGIFWASESGAQPGGPHDMRRESWYCWWLKSCGHQLSLVVGIPLFTTGLRYIQTVVGHWDFWSTNSMHENLRGLFSSLPLPIATLSKELCSRCCKGNRNVISLSAAKWMRNFSRQLLQSTNKKSGQHYLGIFHIVKVG